MSLRDWSSPYNEQNTVTARAASRKKINLASLEQTNDDDLADFKPMDAPRPEPVQKREEPEKPRDPPMQEAVVETYPPLAFSEPTTDLSDKVAYMIRLLEEQRDEKTGHVTEEIILYLFLGIFVIFVIDSFVKTGRYSR